MCPDNKQARAPRGEVGLLFAELGWVAGIFNPSIYVALVLITAYTTLALTADVK